MKKVRMIVSAAVVFAIVGSALAFAPNKFNKSFCVRDQSVGTGTCTTTLSGKKVVTSGGTAYYGYEKGASCAATCDIEIILANQP